MQGESPAYVRDQLGHSSIKMTVVIYGHWIPGANRQAVNRLRLVSAVLLQCRKEWRRTELLSRQCSRIECCYVRTSAATAIFIGPSETLPTASAPTISN